MKILVLMAGPDDAFRQAGHAYPKNLVEIEGLPLVEHVVANLGALRRSSNQFVFLVREDENKRNHTAAVLKLLVPDAVVIPVPPTSGAACSALLAVDAIEPDGGLLIANGDQIIAEDLAAILDGFDAAGVDGGIVVFRAVHPRWSYVRCDAEGVVVETAEKRPISHLATAGTYYFKRGGDFVFAAMEMIKKDAHVDGRFYVCPAYNELILKQRRIVAREIPASSYHSLATPPSVERYAEHLRRLKDRERRANSST